MNRPSITNRGIDGAKEYLGQSKIQFFDPRAAQKMWRHGERHFHVTESGHFSDAETGDCIAERALFTSLCRHESEHNQHSQETARVFENVLTDVLM